ncbi:MAG TPA: DNA ligase D [Gaiellaceae bacterium]|nr:DNA ligase D [Gaiellaceae bacterium]
MPSSDRLRDYRRKRRPGSTPEPKTAVSRGQTQGQTLGLTPGRGRKGQQGPLFVVQRHDARRLHYDLRLERDGALASWAVPKGMPLEPGERHLAVHVEDHPLEYATFEGEIPKGQYGAGTVEIWDRGTYELLEEKKNGGLTFRLEGKRLQGTWTLVPARLDGKEQNWLLLRKRDETAEPSRGRKRRYRPMAATLVEELPRGDGWLFEPKWDGYRALAYVRGGEVEELQSRSGKSDFTSRFETIAKALSRAVRTPDCVLDGEVCALDDNGRASFSAMQQRSGRLVYYVFDLLEQDGKPLLDLPLTERRKRLKKLLAPSKSVAVSEVFDDGEALLQAASEQGLEGVMAKRADSPYEQLRSRHWLKVKVRPRQELVVVGYTKGQRKRERMGALALAVRERGKLRWAGNVGAGFSEDTIDELLARLKPLARPDPPLDEVPKMPRVRKGDITWVEPQLVVEVAFVEWTHDGHLRAPVFIGLREDKEPEDVRREEPLPSELRKGKRTLKLSNLDKVFWPEEGITKGDLLAYYRDIAPVILPHLRNRPFTMKRYPDGIEGHFFFQKDAPTHMPEWIPTRTFEVSTRDKPRERRKIQAPLVNDELALLWMVNMACIDMNTWYSRVDKPDRPDWVLFDLDPSPDAGFPEVVQVARLVKSVLDNLGLTGFPKTSGADGLHVLVPIARRSTYGQARELGEIVARTLASTHRGLVTTEWVKAKRRGVLIDANQNGEGKTIASAYSVRPRPGAPVSTPLRWDEVTEDLDPRDFTMDVVLGRVARDGDLFAGVLEGGQSVAQALASIR